MEKQTLFWMVFAYDQYYPCGGFGDCKGSGLTFDEAVEMAKGLGGRDRVTLVEMFSDGNWRETEYSRRTY